MELDTISKDMNSSIDNECPQGPSVSTPSAEDTYTTTTTKHSEMQQLEKIQIWPEECTDRYTQYVWLRKLYDRLYYSYMNTILEKGAKLHSQRKIQKQQMNKDSNSSMEWIHELSQEDLFHVPKDMQSHLLLQKFQTLYQEELAKYNKSKETNKEGDKSTYPTTTTSSTHVFIRVLWRLIGSSYYIPAGMYQFITVILQTTYPLIVRQILFLLESNSTTSSMSSFYIQGFIYSILLFIIMFIDGLAQERVKFLSFQSGITLRAATISAIYHHTLHMTPQGRLQHPILTSGEVTNLTAIDCQKLFEVTQEGHLIWSTPLSMLIVTALLLVTLGPTTLVGMVSMFLFIPLVQRVVATMMNIRKKRIHYTDARIEAVTVLLTSMRFCKLNHYEPKFLERIEQARDMERVYVRKELALFAMTMFLTVMTPVLACAVTFTAYILIGGEGTVLTAAETFTTLIFFTALRFPINYAGKLIGKLSQGLQACQRLSHFFAREISTTTIQEDYTNDNDGPACSFEKFNSSVVGVDDGDMNPGKQNGRIEDEYHGKNKEKPEKLGSVRLNHGSFVVGNTWSPKTITENATEASSGSPEEAVLDPLATFILSDICLEVKKSQTLAVVGSVGAGKSSLLNALLGNLSSIVNNPAMSSSSVEMNGRIAYASQVPFILNGTVRENILFGLPYHRDLYERVLDACNLVADLQQLGIAGDLTEIGERGVTLSGGQKARVALARCVYSQSDIVLLDDILSALDAATGKTIFDTLLDSTGPSNGLLKNSAVILVTHSTHLLSRMDNILVLSKGNSIFYGSWKELLAFTPSDASSSEAIESIVSSLQEVKSSSDNCCEDGEEVKQRNNYDSEKPSKESGRLMTVEERDFGLSDWRTWLNWFKYAGGFWFILATVIGLGADRLFYVGTELFLSAWTSAVNTPIHRFGQQFPPQSEGLDAQYKYLKVYFIILILSFTGTFARAQWMVQGGARVSGVLVNSMMVRLIHCPMSYFESTPIGRILNRMTYDVDVLDITLSQSMATLMTAFGWFVTGVILQISILPWVGFALAFVAVCYWTLVFYYRKSSVDLQRLDSVSRSPVQAHLSEALDGCATIRAFGKEEHFSHLFRKVLDTNTSALMNFMSAQRWSGARIQSLGSLAILVAACLLIALNDKLKISTGIKAMLLVWSAHFTISLGFLIQALSESEASMTSIERILEMSNLPQERNYHTSPNVSLDHSWPSTGELIFKDVCLRYRPGLPLALNGLSFSLRSGQRCGICGRTGAGKSSISVALFRLAELEKGSITLDGVDLSEIGLADVRGREKGLYIIPQDPVLFAGTIRECLDPFRLCSDDDIFKAISLVRIGDPHVRGLSVLDDFVDEGGRNFSLGERQLLCLARAILAKPKVLILDEATASVDAETDALMQRMIRDHFPGTTILTIAHRLKTIMDYDVILVMEEGRATEFGSPMELLENKGGGFSALVNSTGSESAKLLRSIALSSDSVHPLTI